MEQLFYFFLSLVQSATEFLPVSSSGHLLFFKGLLHRQEIPIIFDIVVHVGSLAAILIYYFSKIKTSLHSAYLEVVEKSREKPQCKWLAYLAVSTAVTFVFFLIFKKSIETVVEDPRILLPAYLITTAVLFSTVWTMNKHESAIVKKGWSLPIVVGLFQGIAILPGVSRAGSTISSLLHFGVKKEEAAYYSFCLAVPAILGALVFNLQEMANLDFLLQHRKLVLLSFGFSILFSYLFLVLLNWIMQKGKFWAFGFYTLLAAVGSGMLFNSTF